jgi:hypothetical protein
MFKLWTGVRFSSPFQNLLSPPNYTNHCKRKSAHKHENLMVLCFVHLHNSSWFLWSLISTLDHHLFQMMNNMICYWFWALYWSCESNWYILLWFYYWKNIFANTFKSSQLFYSCKVSWFTFHNHIPYMCSQILCVIFVDHNMN